MKNKKLLLSLVAILVLALAASIIYSVGVNKRVTESKNAPNFLWSQTADSGSLIGPDDQNLTLTLAGADLYTTRFTDRPLRDAYVVNNIDFAQRWKSYFVDSAPNAVLAFQTAPGTRPVNIVLTLNSAKWNAEAKTWTFDAERIRKQKDSLPDASEIVIPVIDNPEEFVGASLFIDDANDDAYNKIYAACINSGHMWLFGVCSK